MASKTSSQNNNQQQQQQRQQQISIEYYVHMLSVAKSIELMYSIQYLLLVPWFSYVYTLTHS